MNHDSELDRIAAVYLAGLHARDWRTLAAMWARADQEPDVEDMLYDLAAEWDRTSES